MLVDITNHQSNQLPQRPRSHRKSNANGLKIRIHRIAPWTHTHASPTLPINNRLDALAAQTANAMRARVRFLQDAQPPTAGTVDLHGSRVPVSGARCGGVGRVETGGELSDGVVRELGFMMWNWEPVESAELWCWWERLDERDDSTDGNGWRSRPGSGAGGVSARLSGEAWKDWN